MLGGLAASVTIAFAINIGVARELQPDAEWQKHVAEMRKQRKPSPQQIAAKFRKANREKKKADEAHEAYLKSPEHQTEMIRRGNQMAQRARRETAEHLTPNQMHCGMTVPFTELGYKDTEASRDIFELSLLQGGPSMAVPNAGAAQVVKDEGRSITGTVEGVETTEAVTPFVKVFKDGYSFALCAKDSMYDFGDKYGDNKDQFKQHHMNISIVKYSEIVLKENQQPMTPKICFQFCRTVPQMVYFGIRSGTDCYCMPFYTKAESGSEICDNPCPGDTMQMCGGKTKSQLFEMHMCSDTAGDLLYSAVNAEQELVYMYDTVYMTDKLANWLDKTGKELQKIAGLGGDPGAADLAQLAIEEAGSLFDASTGWGACKGQYIMLLDLYTEAKPLYKADFSFAEEITKAEDSIMMMDNLKTKLKWCAKRAEGPIQDAYPFYFDFIASLDEADWQNRQDKYADALVGYYPALYSQNPQADPEMSTCTGRAVGKPMPLPLSACAEACNQEITPPYRCTAFQYFQIQEGDKQMPLCFLIKEIESIRSYRCAGLPNFMQTDTALQKKSVFRSGKNNMTDAKVSSIPMSICEKVKHAKRFSGMSCQAIFGKRSKVLKACPDECEDNQGMKYTALCMTRLSASVPRAEVKEIRKCFGSGNGLQ